MEHPVEAVISNEISLIDVAVFFWRGKWVILLFAILGGVAGYVATKYLPIVYRADVVVMPAGDDESGFNSSFGSIGGLASLAGVSSPGDRNVTEALAILESRQFIRSFIFNNQLEARLYPHHWDESSQALLDLPDNPAPTKSEVIEKFLNGFSVNKQSDTGLTTIAVESVDPESSAVWANQLIEAVNNYMKINAVQSANDNIAYLESELNRATNLQVRQAIFNIIQSHIKNKALANTRDEFVFKIIDPAVVPDRDDFVRPKPVIMIVIGILIALILAIIFLALSRVVMLMSSHNLEKNL